MKKYSLVIFSLLVTSVIVAKTFKTCTKHQEYTLQYPQELVELAASIGMEPLVEKEFLYHLEIYGGEGKPYVFDILTQGKTTHSKKPASVLFWCQKGSKKYLVYAVGKKQNQSCRTYEVKNIFSEPQLYDYEDAEYSDYASTNIQTSRGMIVDESFLGVSKDLSHFSYLDDPSTSGPKNVFPTRENGSLPVTIHSEGGTVVLYLYQDRWLRYLESDV